MGKPITFRLKNESLNQELGTIVFNGKFVFHLNDNISHEYWNKVGFIHLEEGKNTAESDDLFYYLNSRLPITMRKESTQTKLHYIKDSGLRVASDSLVLEPAN